MKNILILLMLALVLVGCADAVSYDIVTQSPHVYGFWGGLWHGFILPFSFIGSLFSDDIAVYAVSNNGGWYNFGFLLGTAITIGGSSRSK